MDATLEHERKLAGARTASSCRSSAAARSSRGVFTSVYYDVPSRSLTNAGITLRRRTERGKSVWQLKLPQADARLELEQPGGPVGPPDELRPAALRPSARRPGRADRRAAHPAARRARRARRLDGRGDGRRGGGDGGPVGLAGVRRDRDRAHDRRPAPARTGSRRSSRAPARRRTDGDAEALPGARHRARGRGAAPAEPFDALRAHLRASSSRSSRTIPARGSAPTPRACTTCASLSAAHAHCCVPAARSIATDTDELAPSCSGSARSSAPYATSTSCSHGCAPKPSSSAATTRRRPCASLRTCSRGSARACAAPLLQARSTATATSRLLDRSTPSSTSLQPTDAEVSARRRSARGEVKQGAEGSRARFRRIRPTKSCTQLRKLGKRARYALELARQPRRRREREAAAGRARRAPGLDRRGGSLARARRRSPRRTEALAAGRLIERERARQAAARAAWPSAWRELDRASQ